MAMSTEAPVKTATPTIYTFFRPRMSARRPKGIEKAAEVIKENKDEIWQDDLKELVDTVADNVEGAEASAVFH